MSVAYHVRKTNPEYGTGFFKYGGITELLDELALDPPYVSDDENEIELYIGDVKETIELLNDDWKDRTFKTGNTDYSADSIKNILQTWLDEVKHTDNYICIERF